MYRSDFQKLAADRLADAQALFKAKRYDAAFYLAGYAVECALKACIARRRRRHEFPLSPEAAREIYSHDFDRLVRAAGLTKSIEQARAADPRFALYWETILQDWSEKSRYDRSGGKGRTRAQALIQAISDPIHGALQCIRTHW